MKKTGPAASSEPRLDAASSDVATEASRVEQTQEILVPSHCTLEGFAAEATRLGGFELARLDSLTRLRVCTQNTSYTLTLMASNDAEVLIEGGRFFPTPARAIFCGSSYGGTLLKIGWIGRGMRMEVFHDGRRIVTSPVESVELLDDTALPGPF